MKRLVVTASVLLQWPIWAGAQVPDSCNLRCDANLDGACGTPDSLILGQNFAHTVTVNGAGTDCTCNHAAKTCTAPWSSAQCGDFNQDGAVGAPDVLIYGAQFGHRGCTYANPETILTLPHAATDEGWKNVMAWADKPFSAIPFCDQDN